MNHSPCVVFVCDDTRVAYIAFFVAITTCLQYVRRPFTKRDMATNGRRN